MASVHSVMGVSRWKSKKISGDIDNDYQYLRGFYIIVLQGCRGFEAQLVVVSFPFAIVKGGVNA